MIIKYMGKLYIISYDLYAIMERYENMPSDLKEGAAALYKEGCIGHIQGAIIEISVPEYISFLESISIPIALNMASSGEPIQKPVICDLDLSDDPIQALTLLDVLAERIIDLIPSCLERSFATRTVLYKLRGSYLIPDMVQFCQSPTPNKDFKPKKLEKRRL